MASLLLLCFLLVITEYRLMAGSGSRKFIGLVLDDEWMFLQMLMFSFHADALIGYVQQCTTTTSKAVCMWFVVFCGLGLSFPSLGGWWWYQKNKKTKRSAPACS